MLVYLDSSALIKRSVDEPESEELDRALETYVADNTALISSPLAWAEVSRALRRLHESDDRDDDEINDAIDVALSGVGERPITADVVSLAVLLDCDIVLAYDERLAVAARDFGLAVSAPRGHGNAVGHARISRSERRS